MVTRSIIRVGTGTRVKLRDLRPEPCLFRIQQGRASLGEGGALGFFPIPLRPEVVLRQRYLCCGGNRAGQLARIQQ